MSEKIPNTAEREASLLNYAGPDRIVSSTEFWDTQADKLPVEQSFQSGIRSLDLTTENFETGELWVVSGPTKHGKTLLCDTMGRNMAAKGIGVLWFSFEVTPKKFLEKYRFDHSPKIYVPLQKISGNLKWIEERIWEAKLKHDCRVIFVDHLHFVVDLLRERNVSIEIGQAMRFLKSVALRHNVCVFLISHLSKLKFETEPTENDLRDSSFIAQESDGTLMIYRLRDSAKNENDPNPYSNRARLVVCCARRSGAMRVRIPLIKSGDDLVELTGGLL